MSERDTQFNCSINWWARASFWLLILRVHNTTHSLSFCCGWSFDCCQDVFCCLWPQSNNLYHVISKATFPLAASLLRVWVDLYILFTFHNAVFASNHSLTASWLFFSVVISRSQTSFYYKYFQTRERQSKHSVQWSFSRSALCAISMFHFQARKLWT